MVLTFSTNLNKFTKSPIRNSVVLKYILAVT